VFDVGLVSEVLFVGADTKINAGDLHRIIAKMGVAILAIYNAYGQE
jgi:hypothetical protein